MDTKQAGLTAWFVSLTIHILLLSSTPNIKLPLFYPSLTNYPHRFRVKIVREEVDLTPPSPKVTYQHKKLKFNQPISSLSLGEEKIEKETVEINERNVSTSIFQKKEFTPFKETHREFKIAKEHLLRRTRKKLIEEANLGAKNNLIKSKEILPQKELSSLGLEGEDVIPLLPETFQQYSQERREDSFEGVNIYTVKRKRDFVSLQKHLVCKLFTYEDPYNREKYFKLKIETRKKGMSLPILPKEVIFLIDCSLSIGKERLKKFKQGLSYCLTNLNPPDLFNIATFKERIKWFSPHPLAPTSLNIKKALSFVDQLRAGKKTDTYTALYECVKTKSVLFPSYIVLFSDGYPTLEMTNPKRIIEKISQLNKRKKSIFAFSGGKEVNRYFLDFISYKNGGWAEYTSYIDLIKDYIANMYDKIDEPILVNLRYHISGVEGKEVFPKYLSDLFKGKGFTLFGKYNEEENISLQLLGDSNEKTYEFVISIPLEEAKKGEKNIAQGWAISKIYHLIGLLGGSKQDEEIIGKIRELCDKFGVKTPYF
ncbi:MAG: hypothetical protein B6D56_03235 [Candidatus Omnitrophica bacterium 4484_70.1]|nr:MAG: hypothetical protein B6D56_03235 [Candidatus Omnitrophica bacterium 4484_70.1]